MGEYHGKTCVRFVPKSNNDRNYIQIFSGQGCYSLIGNNKQGQQPLSLGRGCLDLGNEDAEGSNFQKLQMQKGITCF